MSVRNHEISQLLLRWLDRYSPPLAMKEKPQAQQDEAEALLRVLLRFAPAAGYNGWVADVLDQMEYQMKTRAWPTKGELGAVCSNKRKNAGPMPEDLREPRSEYDIIAEKIRRQDPIGDGWVYGRNAVDLIASGAIRESELEPYRSGLFLSMRENYGEEKARRIEAEMIQRHRDAKACGAPMRREVQIPNKRANTRHSYQGDAA